MMSWGLLSNTCGVNRLHTESQVAVNTDGLSDGRFPFKTETQFGNVDAVRSRAGGEEGAEGERGEERRGRGQDREIGQQEPRIGLDRML